MPFHMGDFFDSRVTVAFMRCRPPQSLRRKLLSGRFRMPCRLHQQEPCRRCSWKMCHPPSCCLLLSAVA